MTGGTILFLTVFLFGTVVQTCMAQSAAEKTKEQLEAAGVRISSTTAFLSAETELSRSLKDVVKVRRGLVSAEKKYEDFQKAIRTFDGQITLMNRQLTQLNTQLANVSDVATNNRLVGAINAIEGKLRLTYQRQEALSKQENDVHAQVSKARDELITHVSEMSQLANELQRGYENSSGPIASLLRKYNILAKANIKLEPTRAFQSNLRKVDQFDLAILSEDVPLRRDGNTYWAGVTINDETIDMVVDSGASIVLLPYEAALKLGVKPGKKDQEIRMVVADGRVINGYKMTIPSMRVGQFTAEKVECAVLGPAATNAEPLLGMSFLGKFKFEINAGDSALRMTHIGEKPKGASDDGTSSILTKRTVFPGEELRHLDKKLNYYVSVNGTFQVSDNKMVSKSGEVTALQLSDTVDDFELEINGDFNQKGGMYFLVGWDLETSSGHMLYYDRLVNFGHWRLMEIRNGLLFRPMQLLSDHRITTGTLKIAVNDGVLSAYYHGKPTFSEQLLDDYSPGVIIMGTKSGRYRGMRIVVDRITISEESAEKVVIPPVEPLSEELFAGVEAQELFPGDSVNIPQSLPTVFIRDGESFNSEIAMKIGAASITSVADKRNLIHIDESVENFELTLVGDMADVGYLVIMLGWNLETITGYRIAHQQIPKEEIFTASNIKEGEKIASISAVEAKPLGKDCTLTLRMFDKVMTIDIDGELIVPHFLLEDYQPGRIMLETAPYNNNGKVIQLKSVTIRKL